MRETLNNFGAGSASARKLRLVLPLLLCASLAHSATDTLRAGRLGSVTIYGTDNKEPKHLVIFLSGDGGWNLGVVDMAKSFEALGNVVVGVNTPGYLKNISRSADKCHYPAADFESLSHLVQMKLGFHDYITPTLVGYSSGATLAYGVLAQAPENTFTGAISLGFCPDLDVDRPLCKGTGLESAKIPPTVVMPGPRPRKQSHQKHAAEVADLPKGYNLLPRANLGYPWYLLSGKIDKVCNIADQRTFVQDMKSAHLVELEKVGHGFGVQKNWMPELHQALDAIVQPTNVASQGAVSLSLPLVELPGKADKKTLVVILSGDGGWANLDKDLATLLNNQGYSVVGLNSLKYFWRAKNPDVVGQDLTKIAQYYLESWNKKKILWIGYSMGADVLPFGLSRLPSELRKRSVGAVYLGLSTNAEFEFRLSNWLSASNDTDGPPTGDEIAKIAKLKNLCIQGASESDSGCAKLRAPANVVQISGGHHFGGAYDEIASIIVKEMGL